jgi:hypothetical protein
MKSFSFGRRALCSVVAILLAACGRSQPPIGAPGAMPQSLSIATYAGRSGSWMLPEAKSELLLYVSSRCSSNCDVYVFSYPGGTQVGMLMGITDPGRICSDIKGNVWIPEGLGTTGDIVEYAHGGTLRIATLQDPLVPSACAVDPTTGDLAVANQSSYQGLLGIYSRARGHAKLYSGYGGFPYSCTYDASGDVFLAGFVGTYAEGVVWLPKGGAQVTFFTTKPRVYPVSGVLWHRPYLTVVNKKWNVGRYALSGQSGKLFDIITLDGAHAIRQYWIEGSYVVAAYPTGKVFFWKYRSGGTIVKTITGVANPFGVTVSLAPHGRGRIVDSRFVVRVIRRSPE